MFSWTNYAFSSTFIADEDDLKGLWAFNFLQI